MLKHNTLNPLILISIVCFFSACSNQEKPNTINKKDSAIVENIIDSSVPIMGVSEEFNQSLQTPPPPPLQESPKTKSSKITPNFIESNDEYPLVDEEIQSLKRKDGLETEVGGFGETTTEDNFVHTTVEEMASFKGGMDAFRTFLEDNLVYPENEKINGIGGVCIVNFVVKTDGSIKDVKVSRSSGYQNIDVEAVRVLKKSSGKWQPGKLKGKAVDSLCTIPITFEINE